jgi:hypothetical protein
MRGHTNTHTHTHTHAHSHTLNPHKLPHLKVNSFSKTFYDLKNSRASHVPSVRSNSTQTKIKIDIFNQLRMMSLQF